jgi:hypothetical protein
MGFLGSKVVFGDFEDNSVSYENCCTTDLVLKSWAVSEDNCASDFPCLFDCLNSDFLDCDIS